jgi:hypothetical protein
MRISGFSFARNTVKLGYPFIEAIRSILPACDEFVIAVGTGDADDRTRETIAAIADPKIKIIDTVWSDVERLRGSIYSQQTNLALAQCRGDWCWYIQMDEVVHEKYLPIVRQRCEEMLADRRVEGLLFKYKHFIGDYDHYSVAHNWYQREIRVVRNKIGVESIGDAQSFRIAGRKLRVALARADVFHYGYVRPPRLMQKRNFAIETTYHGRAEAEAMFKERAEVYDFGSLEKLSVYTETYPLVMRERIAAMDWRDQLQYSGPSKGPRDPLKNRILTFLEQKLFGGRRLGGYRNYVVIRK